ncbi:unnamed protein product (macronuclear) [Paramecium tetraurelia]|uniref:DUF4378 domain-containing protein n=1 Tax=Paramecium tetraurelia TaxID=5888 RepID=A0C217_PARTE|nr:uncharacterized protein GSPATT00034311001 [Paramecium tetraurelia]CAK64834.1 unnamed protein product [Paramecium tetraurelia]|eukprot:XP_001432231.1 hypothetical protein (macronuclear) [Paramecium tetraurelia strain d4-2]
MYVLALQQLEQISFDQSEIKDESFLDQSDLQFSIPNSPKIVTPNTKFLNQIYDKNEMKLAQQQPISQQKQNQFSKPFQQETKKKDFEISTFNEELFFGNQIARPLQVSPNNESKQVITDYREPQVQIYGLNSALRVEEETEKIIEQLVNEASNSLNKIELIQQYAYQTNAGILTNLGVINNFINLMCFAILGTQLKSKDIESNQEEFLKRMNTPYGRKPISRLRQLHGQDDFEDHHEVQPLYQIKQVMETQNQYEKIHNQAIFDAFNEALNILRPFYQDEGIPYPWCTETNISQRVCYGIEDITIILERARQKVFDWSKTLCGLLSDEIPVISVRQLNYEQLIIMQECQGNDSLAYINEERIQSCLQIELQEGERKWSQMTQEYSEVLMEIADYLFEELTEEMVVEVFMK